MTDSPDQPARAASRHVDNLDGHTLESLSDYLDRGREPRDASIESSPAAQNALAALSRLRAVAPSVIAARADDFAPKDSHWIKRILDQIGVQAHAGRDIPIPHDADGAVVSISEGAVRAIIRDAGDRTDGLLVERCTLEGEIETVGAPVDVLVVVSIFRDADQESVVAEFRGYVEEALSRHTSLAVRAITVTVHDSDLDEEDVDSP